MDSRRSISIIGAPLDLGSARRGVDMGPSAIRCADLQPRLEALGIDVADLGNIKADLPETADYHDDTARFLPAILASCAQLAGAVAQACNGGSLPLILGGDHSIAIGTLAGLHSVYGPGAVLWLDAHGDVNRPATSPSGNVHGMPLAAALGRAGFSLDEMAPPPWVDPSRVALVGVRELDPGEKDLIRDLGLSVFTMSDIDRRGMAEVMGEAIGVLAGDAYVHLSLDVDACDPEIAPGVGTPVAGGLSYREAHLAMEMLAEARLLTSIEVVEVNPILDHANTTGRLAVELIGSAMGARIL